MSDYDVKKMEEWLSAPIDELVPEVDPLEAALLEARANWSARSYVQNVPWTATNERRRAKAVELISSLLDNYNRRGSWSPKMRELGWRLVDNARK